MNSCAKSSCFTGNQINPTNLSEVIDHIAKEKQARIAGEIAEVQQKIVAASYDKAASYTAVIIFGGYAGFFAIWQLSNQYLSKEQTLWSALLLMISLLSFVLFEFFKMIVVTRMVLAQKAVLDIPEVQADPQRLLHEIKKLEQSRNSFGRVFIIVWAGVVVICVVFALSGAAVLGYAFISGLVR